MIDYSDYFCKGFCVIPNSGLTQYFGDIDSYDIKNAATMGDDYDPTENDVPSNLLPILETVRDLIIEQHILKVFNSCIPTMFAIWDGVDSGSAKWHNDKVEGCGLDCNYLLYFDDTDEDTGGALWVRGGPDSENKIYPKKDMLIWLNQADAFQHRAEPSKNMRRLAGFDFLLPQIRNQ